MTPGPIPGVSGYAQAALQAKTAYQKALTQLNSNRQTALQQFGYRGDIDPTTGVLTNMSVDPNNPYGAYQSMLNSHSTMQQQVEAQNASRHLGHGGLAAQGLTAEHKSFGADSSQLGTQIMQALSGFQGQQTDAQNVMDSSLYQAQLLAAQQAIASGNFNTPDTSGVDVPPYDSGANDSPAGSPGASSKTNAPAAISAAQKALAARSAALNTQYGLDKKKILPNAYNTNKNKRG